MARKTKMNMRVHRIRPVSQAHLDLSTAEMPRKMKMMVSAILARVFIVYLTAVRDFCDMLASTYLLQPMPQKVILWLEEVHQQMSPRLCSIPLLNWLNLILWEITSLIRDIIGIVLPFWTFYISSDKIRLDAVTWFCSMKFTHPYSMLRLPVGFFIRCHIAMQLQRWNVV